MKRFWFGVILLILLLGIGIWSSVYLEQIHTPLRNNLRLASQAALENRWDTATDLALGVKDRWEQQRSCVASLSSHAPMEIIDCQFEVLLLYIQTRETAAFSVCCAELSAQIAALAEAHAMSWWNIL